MAACSKYLYRFKKALEFRKLPFPTDIINYIGKRANSDRSLDGIICSALSIIEPPNCTKSHCPSFTSFAFCNCSLSLVPGRCKLNLDYLKKKREREEKILNARLEQIPKLYFPLSEDTIKRIASIRKEDWERQLKRIKRNAPKVT